MKPISLDDADTVNTFLTNINGRSTSHTYTSVLDLRLEAMDAEKQLEKLGVPKADRLGAVYATQSGSKLPSAYKYEATVTVVRLIRKRKGWYVLDGHRSFLYPRSEPRKQLILTEGQDAKAIASLRKRYEIATRLNGG